jgi:glycosyltransferase involved in cell wall biosynthesis
MKILLVTNFIPHYRAPLYERLHREFGMEFILYSRGTEEYWQPHLGVTPAELPSTTITGREFLPKLRLNPGLLAELWRRDYDILIKCVNGRLELPAAYLTAKLRRRPFVLLASLWRHPTTPFHHLTKPLLRHIYAHSDAIICDGTHVATFVAKEGADPSKVFVAELAIDNEAFSAKVDDEQIREIRDSVGAEGRPLVLSVARLVEQKGLDVLIEAVAGLRDLDPVLAVVGTGHFGPDLTALAKQRHVDLRLLGGRPPHTMPAIYAAADVLVMASVTTPLVTEVWGLAVNEAMCQGVPVVTTSAVGAAAGGLVVDGETGLVVPERDPAALSAALRRLLEDPDQARRLGEAGRRRVMLTNYDAMVDGFRGAIAKAGERAKLYSRKSRTAKP